MIKSTLGLKQAKLPEKVRKTFGKLETEELKACVNLLEWIDIEI